ncbi:toll/interleukin-1 receptor domain-containing protein, partial [Acinetobacter baumannii]
REQATIIAEAEQRSPVGSTFLSHSSKDTDLLPGVISLLERHGATVYIDKKDEALPIVTSRDTAAILRGRIRDCRKFILLTTPHSKDSSWMPWELGLSYGTKSSSRTAILPSPDRAYERRWAEQEYLGVYNRIGYGDLQGEPSPVFMVWDQERNEATELSALLAN